MSERGGTRGLPAEHAGEFYHSFFDIEHPSTGGRVVVADLLGDADLDRCRGGDLGQVSNHQHLTGRTEAIECGSNGRRRAPADPRIDLVEHDRLLIGREDQTQREHRPCQLATGRHLRQRKGWHTRVRSKKKPNLVSRIIAAHLDLDACVRHGEFPQFGGDPLGQPGRNGTPTFGHPRGFTGHDSQAIVETGGQLLCPLVVSLEILEALGERPVRGDQSGQGSVAVLALQGREQLTAFPNGVEPCRIVDDRFGSVTNIGADIREVSGNPEEAGVLVRERCPIDERRDGRTNGVDRPVFVGEVTECLGRPQSMRAHIGEQLLFSSQAIVLVGFDDTRRIELVELKSQDLDLTSSRRSIAPERGKCRSNGRHVMVRRTQCRQVDLPEPIERVALAMRRKQFLLGVLSVQIDQRAGPLGERRHGCHRPVDVGPRTTVCGDDTPQDDFVSVTVDEPTFDLGLGCSAADPERLRSPSREQRDGIDDQGLAGTGLAGHRGETGTKFEMEIGDDTEIMHRQFGQHARRLIDR